VSLKQDDAYLKQVIQRLVNFPKKHKASPN
jgi:hypothetical protein